MSPAALAHHASLELRLESPEEAAALAAALLADDPGSIQCEARGATLAVQASSASVMGLLRTVDDLIACVRGSAG